MKVEDVTAANRMVDLNTARLEQQNNLKAVPPPPGMPLAVPAETARSQVNAASMAPALMMPTPDNIYTIGSVAIRGGPIKPVSGVTSSWGFF